MTAVSWILFDSFVSPIELPVLQSSLQDLLQSVRVLKESFSVGGPVFAPALRKRTDLREFGRRPLLGRALLEIFHGPFRATSAKPHVRLSNGSKVNFIKRRVILLYPYPMEK